MDSAAILSVSKIFAIVALVYYGLIYVFYLFIKKKGEKESVPLVPNKEICVICHEETDYLKETPISKRRGYVEGMGQLCDDCDGYLNHRAR